MFMAKKYQPFSEWLSNIEKAYEGARGEYLDNLEETVRDNYNRIIDSFYGDYTPRYYKRKGKTSTKTGGLYDLLVINRHPNNMGLDVEFDPTKLIRRDGYNGEDGLYTTVFLQGYHGGAYIPEAHKFLVPWTYPYREYNGNPEPWSPNPWEDDKSIKHGWSPAVRTVAPYRKWKSFVVWYNRGQYQKDFNVIMNKYLDKYF